MAATKNTKAFYKTKIPSDWSALEFGDVFNFLKTFSFSREQLTGEPTKDGIRNIHYGDIHATYENEVLDFEIEKTIPYLFDGIIDSKSFDDENFPALKEGDLIIADASEDHEGVCDCVELKNINGNKVISGLHTFAARASEDKIALGFRTYTLQHEQVIRELRRIATGTSVYGVSKTNLSKVKIPLPPLPEQKAIAQVLSTADAAIHTNEKLIAQKELRKKWLMQQLLTGKKRLKGFEGEWKEKKLGELFSHLRNTNDGGDGHSVMTISAKLGLVSQEDKFDRIIAGESLKKYTQLSKGDFAYNKGNSKTYPMGCIYRLEEKESALVPFVYICFRPSDKVDGMFYKQWFVAHGLDSQLNKIITSGARGDGLLNVNNDDFFKLKVPYPPKEEQTAIAQVLQAADKEISLLKAKAEKLREQKKGLMQVLLTGKVRLKLGRV
ncbi:MAG: restriction endonuclease subunit S [Saprospiraceae bacterium]|nr:restriction endonuclease subunit S [Saprospiraceae bacterium]